MTRTTVYRDIYDKFIVRVDDALATIEQELAKPLTGTIPSRTLISDLVHKLPNTLDDENRSTVFELLYSYYLAGIATMYVFTGRNSIKGYDTYKQLLLDIEPHEKEALIKTVTDALRHTQAERPPRPEKQSWMEQWVNSTSSRTESD